MNQNETEKKQGSDLSRSLSFYYKCLNIIAVLGMIYLLYQNLFFGAAIIVVLFSENGVISCRLRQLEAEHNRIVELFVQFNAEQKSNNN